jgi:hypothetical protein
MMVRLVSSLTVMGFIAAVAGSIAFAQTPTTPSPFVDRGAEKQRIEQQELSKKWAGCRKQAQAQKIKLWRRNKFMNDCMAK